MERIISILLTILLVGGCSYSVETELLAEAEYRRISPEEALEIMDSCDAVVLDVRTQAEFDGGHIPGAILIPLDEITENAEDIIYRFGINQVILVYCQSGRRSEIAARALIELGYVNVFDFGGINSWIGEVVR